MNMTSILLGSWYFPSELELLSMRLKPNYFHNILHQNWQEDHHIKMMAYSVGLCQETQYKMMIPVTNQNFNLLVFISPDSSN